MPILNIVCPICTEMFDNADEVYSTSCGHLFHFSCMNQWQNRGTSCPQCRTYNPTSHKLYLSFDGSDEDLAKNVEIELKLKTSNERITELLLQINESESNFLDMQKQFTAMENSKRDLEERISHMNDSENNFLQLQGQYTDSSELVKALQERINQLYIENECKSKELQLKRIENESLKTSLDAAGNNLSDDILQEKVKILEKKLKHISEEFEKEISTSTQLSIEKMKLQSYINHMNSLHNVTHPEPMRSEIQPNIRHSGNPKKVNEMQRNYKAKSNQTGDDVKHCVFITGLSLDQMTIPLVNIVFNLAAQMGLLIIADNLINTKLVDKNEPDSSTRQLCVEFKSIEVKQKFLSRRYILKSNPKTKNIFISEFISEGLFALLKYAKAHLRDIGFVAIYIRNNKVFAKKNADRFAVHITDKSHVDLMKGRSVPEPETTTPENCNNVDENYYQLN